MPEENRKIDLGLGLDLDPNQGGGAKQGGLFSPPLLRVIILLNLAVVATLLALVLYYFWPDLCGWVGHTAPSQSLAHGWEHFQGEFGDATMFGLIPVLMLLLLQIPAYFFLVRPLRQIAQAVGRIQAGNLADRVAPVVGPREIVELNTGIDEMRRSLHAFTTDLNAQVSARTVEVDLRNHQLGLALDNMARGVVMYEPDGTIAICNHQILEMFGFSEADTQKGVHIGKLLTQVLDLYDRPDGMTNGELLQRLRGSGGGIVQEFMLPLRNGRTIHVVYKPIETGGFIHTCEDITQRLNYEEALRISKTDAEQANEAKSQFLANMSHELRTPLNAIIGFSEIILDGSIGAIKNPKMRDYLEDLHECGRHLLSLVNDILDLSKAEAGQLEMEWEAVDTARVLQDSVRVMSDTARRQNIELHYEVEANLPLIWSSARRLRQILLNLLSNAIKFTPDGGKVVVTASVHPSGDVLLKIIDTGIGMTRQEVGIAFNPFQQIESSLSRHYQGTGLGLSLTRRLVELLAGTMSVESELGKGTAITILLNSSDFPMAGEYHEIGH